jgi:hypothetical protein
MADRQQGRQGQAPPKVDPFDELIDSYVKHASSSLRQYTDHARWAAQRLSGKEPPDVSEWLDEAFSVSATIASDVGMAWDAWTRWIELIAATERPPAAKRPRRAAARQRGDGKH